MDFSPREVAFHLIQFSDKITGHSEPRVHFFVTVTKLISRGRNKYVHYEGNFSGWNGGYRASSYKVTKKRCAEKLFLE